MFQAHNQHLKGSATFSWFPSWQPLYVSCGESWLWEPALHHLVPGYGWCQDALFPLTSSKCKQPMPWGLLHFPDQVWEWGQRILYLAGKRGLVAVTIFHKVFSSSLEYASRNRPGYSLEGGCGGRRKVDGSQGLHCPGSSHFLVALRKLLPPL